MRLLRPVPALFVSQRTDSRNSMGQPRRSSWKPLWQAAIRWLRLHGEIEATQNRRAVAGRTLWTRQSEETTGHG
jgi:hypothetical protein